MPDDKHKTRWLQIGELWVKEGDVSDLKASGFLSMGLLGEVSVILRPQRHDTSRLSILIAKDSTPLKLLERLVKAVEGGEDVPF